MCIRDRGRSCSSVVIITYFSFFSRRPSTTISTLVQQYISNTHVVHSTLGTFLEGRLALNNENAPGFASEPIRSTPTVALPLSLQAPSPVLRGTPVRSRCVARSFRLSTRFQRSSIQVFSRRHNTHICHACMISHSIIKRTMIRLLPALSLIHI